MKSLRSYLVLFITSLHTVILQVVLLELSLLVFAYLYSEYSIKGRLRLRSKTSTLLHKPKLQEFHLPILQIKEGIRILTYISCVWYSCYQWRIAVRQKKKSSLKWFIRVTECQEDNLTPGNLILVAGPSYHHYNGKPFFRRNRKVAKYQTTW